MPPLFAPATFSKGSSVSHLETGNIPGGAVMEHAFSPGEIIRQFPRFEAAAMRDIGWTTVNLNNLSRSPTADFSVNDETATLGQTLTFSDLSFSGSQPVTSWLWNFGDGTTSTQPSPTKAYNGAGTFTVTLTVTTGVGSDSETRNNLITVAQGPIANFTATNTTGQFPLTVQFTDTSTGNGGTINSRQWNFGDGSASTQQNPSHTYQAAGSFSVSLTISASNGTDAETKSSFITVTAPPPPPDPIGGGSTGGCGGKSTKEDGMVATAAMGILCLAGMRRRRSN